MDLKTNIRLSFFVLLCLTTAELSAKDRSTCYSAQLLSSRDIIKPSKRFPQGSKIMQIGRNYTVRNGCFETVKELKKHFSSLTKGFPHAVIVSTYRFRFTTSPKKQKQLQEEKIEGNFTHCRGIACKKKAAEYAWENVSLANAKLLVNPKFQHFSIKVDGAKTQYQQEREKPAEQEQKIPDVYRFYIDPSISIYEGQTPIGGSKLRGNTEKFTIGLQYWHFFNQYWHFYTDIRIIPYHTEKNHYKKNSVSLDIKEFYLMSDKTFDNQADFLIGRKVLKDKRSWYYNTSLDTLGVFNKHDLMRYELYAGTRLTSNRVIESATANKHDLKNIKFLIGHASYEYYMKNTLEIFGLYEDTAGLEDRKLKWIGVRALGTLFTTMPSLHYWIDAAKVSGTLKENFIEKSLSGRAFDLGLEYDLENEKDSFAFSYAYGSGGSSEYREPYLSNNRSDYLSKYLSFRYYGSFFDPELTNIKIASLYYVHKLNTPGRTAVVALHNYKQVSASSSQYIASGYTVAPNGYDTNLGNELDFILGQYMKGQYNWRFVLAYFLGGSAYNSVASHKDGIYGAFNVRYYW